MNEKRKSNSILSRAAAYPVWQCDKMDSYLSAMENSGYRLIGFSRLGRMQFQTSAAKKVRYFTTYTCLKERSMNGIEDELRKLYGANPVPAGIGTRHIHRITQADADFQDLEALRRKYLPRVILERLFFGIGLSAGILLLSVLFRLRLLFWAASILAILMFLYYSLGLLSVVFHHSILTAK